MNEKWTPGPWKRFDNGGVTESGHAYGETYAARVWGPRGPGHGLVADCSQGTGNDIANAKLIAAAPKLYASLKAVEWVLTSGWSDRDSMPAYVCPVCACIESIGHRDDCELNAALKAARGEE